MLVAILRAPALLGKKSTFSLAFHLSDLNKIVLSKTLSSALIRIHQMKAGSYSNSRVSDREHVLSSARLTKEKSLFSVGGPMQLGQSLLAVTLKSMNQIAHTICS